MKRDTNYINGDVAQLGEHYTCTVGVAGSNPVISTMVVEDSDKTAEVRRYRTSSSDNITHTTYDTALKQVLDYYDEWGYEPTLKYLRGLNSSGEIPLMTRVKVQDIITERYLNPSPRALSRKFKKGVV